jgi:phosphoribosylamine---glycine ligase
MRVMVIGGGGRESAICRALATARPQPSLLIVPGNPGTAALGTNIALRTGDLDAVVGLAARDKVDLVVVGPEQPLVAGLADHLRALGIRCCGPSARAAQLEGSKIFARELAQRVDAPSPTFRVVAAGDDIAAAVRAFATPPVVKADVLAAGKGVLLPDDFAGCERAVVALLDGRLGIRTTRVVLEERLRGVEASLIYACAGGEAVLLPHARDHKRLGDGDQGPNTGGMGAISPNPAMSATVAHEVRCRIVEPMLAAMVDLGSPFAGFLFVGVMLTAEGPRLLEINVRLGDPEAEAILPRLKPGVFLELCERIATGRLDGMRLEEDSRPVCAVVLAAPGYPEAPHADLPLTIDAGMEHADRWVDHAGTKVANGRLVTAGGRVLVIVGRGADLARARETAYEGVELVRGGLQYRHDIGRI